MLGMKLSIVLAVFAHGLNATTSEITYLFPQDPAAADPGESGPVPPGEFAPTIGGEDDDAGAESAAQTAAPSSPASPPSPAAQPAAPRAVSPAPGKKP